MEKGDITGQERGSQVPDCGVGDEFSMSLLKSHQDTHSTVDETLFLSTIHASCCSQET